MAALLRDGTADLHVAAEGQRFQQEMVRGQLDRASFVRFLQEVGLVHDAIDAALDAHAAGNRHLAALVKPAHRRSGLVRRDLDTLSAAPRPEVPLGATERFVEHLRRAAAVDPTSLVGILYVTEGATNGNKVIAKAVQSGLGLAPGEAMGYLDPHGTDQRKRWMEFKATLDTLAVTPEERSSILDAARRTFQYFLELSPELDAAMAVRARA